ncbi:MAG TPA: glycoside hydrolase family 31 protein, partial [Anaerolineae bacterium]|nr:glycoside hydrolase family 31 protein [Anaerolineae bacterium]
SGFGFWSHDMGGFEQTASADVYKRWCAFGLLSSHSRLHGNSSYRVPWLFDEAGSTGPTASDVLRFFTQLKCRLAPYVYNAAVEAHIAGTPVLRAMVLEFPADPGCDTLDRQYMFGGKLLVAPVFRPDGVVDYYLPAGKWTNFLNNEEVVGGRWIREQHGYLSLPLLARPNSVIPVGANDQRPDYDFSDGVTFHVFALDDGATAAASVPTLKGETAMTVSVSRAEQQIQVQAQGATKPWNILLRGIKAVQAVTGGAAHSDPLGARIVADAGATTLTIRL